jgi:hypothetical protein
MKEIIAAVIGGFLAAGAGWFLQWRLEAARIKRLKQLLILGITDDLKTSIDFYNRLIDDWDKSQIVWFTTLNELRESRQTYLKNREWLVLINDESLRQKVFKYYHRSADHINLLENQQNRKYNIQGKLDEISRDILLRDKELSFDEAQQQAIRAMYAEDKELVNLNSFMPQNIQKVRDFKIEANDLLTKFESKKV